MSIFKFKQFEVDQTGCAMKINTDGVLIAAMADHAEPVNILDIGTGTGVIALMLAQRFPKAHVHAVEIDQQAAETAGRNFQQSVFNNRLTVYHTAIEDFKTNKKFDLIVSNPPFFVNDLKNSEVRKGVARHADQVFFIHLVSQIHQLLSEQGKAWLILPVKQAEEVIRIASGYGLHLNNRINIRSDEHKPIFRQIIAISGVKTLLAENDFFIYESMKVHTLAYQQLLKDFFVVFG